VNRLTAVGSGGPGGADWLTLNVSMPNYEAKADRNCSIVRVIANGETDQYRHDRDTTVQPPVSESERDSRGNGEVPGPRRVLIPADPAAVE